MEASHFPEQNRRRELLRVIHEWTQAQPQAEPILGFFDFAALVEVGREDPDNYEAEQVYRQAAGHVNRLRRLVDEGYINARYGSHHKGGPPFNELWMRGLTERGLQLIEELPDPQAEMLDLLDDIAEAIRTLGDAEAPPEQKRLAERAVDELKHFLRGLPPEVATELGSRIFGG